MNFKKVTRSALMSCFFLMFAIRPGFGKLNLEDFNMDKNEWNRLTETVLHYKKARYGFELHCTHAQGQEGEQLYPEKNRGFVSTAFIE